jgi:hypothetical protein
MTGVQMIAISGHILPRPSHHNPGRGRKATSALEAKRTSANATLPLIAPLVTRSGHWHPNLAVLHNRPADVLA